MDKILGMRVRDRVTDFIGIATGKIIFLNGCVQYSIAPKVSRSNRLEEELNVDIQQLQVYTGRKWRDASAFLLEHEDEDEVESQFKKSNTSGGPSTRGSRQR